MVRRLIRPAVFVASTSNRPRSKAVNGTDMLIGYRSGLALEPIIIIWRRVPAIAVYQTIAPTCPLRTTFASFVLAPVPI
ncbi:hypothetical protein THIARS_60309 [Thiomonas delicata]|uniref:Uncharacterized protein n=1 Tax=Thiomonas delicata TaxID=364030 RepID=A0A238D2U9_THIDL|nr:hypothetical protein THIARS_60309 [Thiomonas delicata]